MPPILPTSVSDNIDIPISVSQKNTLPHQNNRATEIVLAILAVIAIIVTLGFAAFSKELIQVIQIGFCPVLQASTPEQAENNTPVSSASSGSVDQSDEETMQFLPLLELNSEDEQFLGSIETLAALQTENAIQTNLCFENCEELLLEHLSTILEKKDPIYEEIDEGEETNEDGIEMYKVRGDLRIFSIESSNLVFKMCSDPSTVAQMHTRFKNIEYTRDICKELNLTSVYIPRPHLTTITKDNVEYTVLVQEKLSPMDNESFRISNTPQFNLSLKHLVTVICESQYGDFHFDNNPILPEEKIGMIDLELVNHGDLSSTLNSVLNIVEEDQKRIIECVAKQYGYTLAGPRNFQYKRNSDPTQIRHTACPHLLEKHFPDYFNN